MTARQDDLETSLGRDSEMVADQDADDVCCFGMVRSNCFYVRPQIGHLSLQLAAHYLYLQSRRQSRRRSRHCCLNPNFAFTLMRISRSLVSDSDPQSSTFPHNYPSVSASRQARVSCWIQIDKRILGGWIRREGK